MYRLALCLMLVASVLATPRPSIANVIDSYDTVEFVEANNRNSEISGGPPSLTVRGIPAGGSAPVTKIYRFFNSSAVIDGVEAALHCQRLAVLAMSKPGKFQFAVVLPAQLNASGCRLTLVAP